MSSSASSSNELSTATEMAHGLRSRAVSSEELVRRAIERAEAWQGTSNAFSQLWAEEALAEARSVDARPDGAAPFAGVPVAVKDLYHVAGHETSGCSAAYAGYRAAGDAPTIAALRQAGLVVIGKTNQHELAAGGTNAVSAIGPTHNPWDRDRITGGSSGGSGAAVAAGIVPWTLGSDTGGSIRIPASLCGTFGLKPTTGKHSVAGMLPLAPSLDTPGPMSATLEDLAALYDLMSGQSVSAIVARPTGELRIGIPDGYFARLAHPAILAEVHATAATFEGAGVEVRPADGTGIDDVRSVWRRIAYREFAEAHRLSPERYEKVAPTVRDWMEQGRRFSEEELADARRRRLDIATWFGNRLRVVDALLIPSTPYWAPALGATEVDLGTQVVQIADAAPGWFTCAANIAGLPAMSLPAGRSPEGLPFGVSLVGRAGEEAALLQLGAIWAGTTGYTPSFPTLPQ
jgi:aspartyl-tRNA(Asn)/glutamyl-tRNA(Gln) amidotransferase subunit A